MPWLLARHSTAPTREYYAVIQRAQCWWATTCGCQDEESNSGPPGSETSTLPLGHRPSPPLYPNSVPTYPIIYAFLWKPTNQLSGRVVDDMAIYSSYNNIFPLLILTPFKTSPFIRISFNFSLSFLSSSACFQVRSGEIKMSLKFSEFKSFRDPETTLHLTATDSIFKLTSRLLPLSAISLSSAPLFLGFLNWTEMVMNWASSKMLWLGKILVESSSICCCSTIETGN